MNASPPLPSVAFVHRRIKAFVSMDHAKMSVAEILRCLKAMTPGYHDGIIEMPPPTLFRSVGPFDSLPLQESLLWEPPPGKVLKMGRLNQVGQSMFYSADSEKAALMEKSPQQGRILVVTRFEPTNLSRRLSVWDLGARERTSNRRFREFGRRATEQVDQVVGAHRQSNRLIRDFLVREFLKPVPIGCEDRYKLTVAIAEDFLGDGAVDGIVYPSVQNNGQDHNFALKPEKARELYKPAGCWASYFPEVHPGRITITRFSEVVRFGADGGLEWRDIHQGFPINPLPDHAHPSYSFAFPSVTVEPLPAWTDIIGL